MTNEEQRRILALQSDASDLWAGLRALRALTEQITREHPAELHDGNAWGDDHFAADVLASSLEEKAAQLASSLDPVAIGQQAKGGEAA